MLNDDARQAPELPAAYEYHFFEQVDSLRDKAIELANNGAQEGCLIWSLSQARPSARLDKQWICNEGDLHCSVLLRPDFDVCEYYQMLIVAAVSLGNAIAVHVSPMTALGYLWPNDLCIARRKIASLWLDKGISQGTHWLAITLSVNVINAPQNAEIDAISIREAEGLTDLNSKLLLESFAREFIKQINFWSDRGFQYVLEQWRIRLQNTRQPIVLDCVDKTIRGIAKDIDQAGNIEVTDGAGHHNVLIQHHMGLYQ